MSEKERLDQSNAEQLDVAESPKAAKAPKEKKAKEKKAKEKKGLRIVRWWRELRSELKKVQWPSFKEVLKHTGTVILCVLIVGVFIWVFDLLAKSVVDALLNLF